MALPQKLVPGIVGISTYVDFAYQRHMQLAAVAAACAVNSVPWHGFLGVSNAVGPSAHEEWKASHEQASVAAQALAMAFVESVSR